MNNLERVEKLIKENIPDAEVKVSDMTGTQDHLELLIVSDEFKNKSLLQQHQHVMKILKAPLAGSLHAVKIKTLTHETYKQGK